MDVCSSDDDMPKPVISTWMDLVICDAIHKKNNMLKFRAFCP